MLKILQNRRTIRKYSSREIDDVLLYELFEAAFRTSNTGNMQLYSVVVTRSEDMKKKLSPFHFNQPMVMQAPVVLTFCADLNRFVTWCNLRNAKPGYDNFQSFITSAIDTAIAAQTFCIAAEAKGLGICYLGTVTYMTQEIIEALELPKYVVPLVTLTVGYPEDTPLQPERLPVEGLLHSERYTDYSPEDVSRIYAAKENLPVNQNYVAENGKETLAQVFTDVRYTKKNNEFFSSTFLEALKKQGFLH
ncbi:MAG: nitroreductase family protein [Bacteroidales bacterium]|jgi:nitroreductase|nr:nitroreductase family protein [Bacteroidales bacterium]